MRTERGWWRTVTVYWCTQEGDMEHCGAHRKGILAHCGAHRKGILAHCGEQRKGLLAHCEVRCCKAFCHFRHTPNQRLTYKCVGDTRAMDSLLWMR